MEATAGPALTQSGWKIDVQPLKAMPLAVPICGHVQHSRGRARPSFQGSMPDIGAAEPVTLARPLHCLACAAAAHGARYKDAC